MNERSWPGRAAIAAGRVTVRELAGALQQSAAAVSQQLDTLCGLNLLRHLADPLRRNRGSYEIAEPIVAFHHAIMYPGRNRRRLEQHRGHEVWADAQATYRTQILGPHVEQLARHWTDRYASAETVGTESRHVGRTYASDPAARTQREVDVVVLGADPKLVTALGEAKTGLFDGHALAATELRRRLLANAGIAGAETCKLLLFSIEGFTPDVVETAAARPDIELIDLERLYSGS